MPIYDNTTVSLARPLPADSSPKRNGRRRDVGRAQQRVLTPQHSPSPEQPPPESSTEADVEAAEAYLSEGLEPVDFHAYDPAMSKRGTTVGPNARPLSGGERRTMNPRPIGMMVLSALLLAAGGLAQPRIETSEERVSIHFEAGVALLFSCRDEMMPSGDIGLRRRVVFEEMNRRSSEVPEGGQSPPAVRAQIQLLPDGVPIRGFVGHDLGPLVGASSLRVFHADDNESDSFEGSFLDPRRGASWASILEFLADAEVVIWQVQDAPFRVVSLTPAMRATLSTFRQHLAETRCLRP